MNTPSDTQTSAPPVRTVQEIGELVEAGEFTEADLAPYFVRRESASHNLEPVFVLNEDLE